MTTEILEQTPAYARGKQGWLPRYVSAHAMSVVHNVYSELSGSEPVPFNGWQLWTAHASDNAPAMSHELRQHLVAGGIAILLATPAAAKARWLSSLTACDDRSSRQDLPSLHRETAPPSPFAIDDAGQYERGGVLTSIALATSSNRGFVLTFRDADEFRGFEIAPYIANQKVVILTFEQTFV
jgi:hypothetical protein